MSADETVEVPVAALEALRDIYSGGGDACNIKGGWGYCPAIEDLIARIPEPPWEPDDDVVLLFSEALSIYSRRVAIRDLRHLHAAGLLRDDL